MSAPLTPHELASLGLEGVELGEQVEVPWPAGAPGEAQSLATIGVTLAALYSSMGFSAVADAVTARAGLFLERGRDAAHVLRVTSDSERRLDLRVGNVDPTTAAAAVYRPADEPGVLLLDLRRLDIAAVFGPTGGLVVRVSDSGVQIAHVSAPLTIESLAPIEAPVEQWAQAAGDAWVSEQVAAQLSYRSTWSTGVAAGMVARLVEPASGAGARAALQKLLRGEVDPAVAAPRQWARQLTDAEVRTLNDLALAKVDVLHREIDALADDVHEDRPHWRERWRRLCHHRDDVENVRVLLHEAGRAEVLNEALLDLDRAGESLRLSVPWTDDLADERARRVASADPLAWWGTYQPDEMSS